MNKQTDTITNVTHASLIKKHVKLEKSCQFGISREKKLLLLAYRLPLMGNCHRSSSRSCIGRGPRRHGGEPALELLKPALHALLVLSLVVLVQVEVRPPVGRVEAPVAGAVLHGGVRVADEAGGAEQPVAVETLDAARGRTRARLGQEDAGALAEALVLHAEREGRRLGVEAHGGGARRVTVQQEGGQALRVGLGDESALVGSDGQDLEGLERVQLVGGARGAVDAHLVARLMDRLETDRLQHRVKDL